jgi:hypothetical protein
MIYMDEPPIDDDPNPKLSAAWFWGIAAGILLAVGGLILWFLWK